jgi:hypothetical protein
MENLQEKEATSRTIWEQPKLNKLSLKDAQTDTGSSGADSGVYS